MGKPKSSTPDHQTWVVLSDAHVPFHNAILFHKIARLMRDLRPHGLVLAGDFMDLFSLSKYAADSLYQLKDVTLSGEYQAGNQVLDLLDDAMPPLAKKVYVYGNHEDRYLREMMKGDNGKYGEALTSPVEGLRLGQRGYVVFEKWQDDAMVLGDHLEVTHGIFTNKHVAAKHLEEFQGSVMFGHTHRMQTHHLGKRAAFNIGCTCDIHSRGFAYMPRPQRMKWSNGFAIVRIDREGDYHAEIVQAHKDCFFAAGRAY